MNYLIIEILACLLLAGAVGMLMGWFLRGGCRAKLEENSLDWQEKLRVDSLASKNKLLSLEDEFLQKLHQKEDAYREKLTQLAHNGRENSSADLEKELHLLKERLAQSEVDSTQREQEWRRSLEEMESGVQERRSANKISFNKVKQENLFLKSELDRSVSQLNEFERDNRLKDREIDELNKQLVRVIQKLNNNNQKWQMKLEKSELSWVEKVAELDESSLSVNHELNVVKRESNSAKATLFKIEESLDECQKELQKKSLEKRVLKSETVMRRDNLKLIKGIGIVLEKKLNKLGIDRFSQIALWGESDVKNIEKILSFKGRIKREKWVEQARRMVKV